MKQFLLSCSPENGALIKLSGKDYHYLVNVRRLKKGDKIPARLPGGGCSMLSILDIDKKNRLCICAAAAAGKDGADETARIPKLVLFQVLPKGAKFDLIVRQCAESGVLQIVPFTSEHSVKHLKNKENAAFRLERWRRIIREARQQSNSPVETTISDVLDFDEALELRASLKDALSLVFLSPSEMPEMREAAGRPSLHGVLEKNSALISFFIGAEGGFSKNEVAKFLEADVLPVSLGGTVLRAETAAVAAASVLKLLVAERDRWRSVNDFKS